MTAEQQGPGHPQQARAAGAAWPGQSPPDATPAGPRPAARRRWAVAGWLAAGLGLSGLLLRISLGSPVIADGANPTLQAWDMLHGHVLLHGWVIADANYYTFELPLYALAGLLAGPHNLAAHIGSALTYLIVAAFAVALAAAGTRGAAAAARCGAVVAVLAAPLMLRQGVAVLLEEPDHIGTAVFLLASYLLIDRAPARRFTAPLLGLVLCAGQVGDATVAYIALPAILAVSAYRMLAARRVRTPGLAIAAAAVASLPAALAVRALMQHAGAYATVHPPARISPVSQWPHHAVVTLHAVLTLFGAQPAPGSGGPGIAAAAFGLACLLAAAAGFAKTCWTWRTAGWAEQLLAATIVINLAVYLVSALPNLHNSREIAAVLPCGAVLAARVLLPARLTSAPRARVTLAVAALAAVVPLAAAAVRPPATAPSVPLAGWLRAHRLSYGIAGYWDASSVTLSSGDRVRVRAVVSKRGVFHAYNWETNLGWYAPPRYDATFVIADPPHAWPTENCTAGQFERAFGRPAMTRRVAGYEILIYRRNLLALVGSPAR